VGVGGTRQDSPTFLSSCIMCNKQKNYHTLLFLLLFLKYLLSVME
jgi:hypothetical protein